MKLYSIYDKVAQTYGAPTCQVNDAVAKRWFKVVCDETPIPASDLDLAYLGDYHEDEGVIVAQMPVIIAHGEVVDHA